MVPYNHNMGFKASDLVKYGPGFHRPPTDRELAMRKRTGMSDNYHGDPGNPLNHSVVGLPKEENCSFYLTGLPPNVTAADITCSVRNIGRVYAVHIENKEVAVRGTAAAKLVFFDAASARRFYAATRQRFHLKSGGSATVIYNRNTVATQSGLGPEDSRVLLITGPRPIVNVDFLREFFRSKISFDTEIVVPHSTHPEVGILEWRFCSYRAQAKSAFKAIREEPAFENTWVHVAYDRDPCDIVEPVS